MQTFKVSEDVQIECLSKNTKTGFLHRANLIKNGVKIDTCICRYYNRTWESYQFQSVLSKMLDRIEELTEQDKKVVLERGVLDDPAMKRLNTVGMVASLGNIFGKNQKEKNDWKARMLKAGLEGSGLIMPDDWDTLSEDVKETRLDGMIKILSAKS